MGRRRPATTLAGAAAPSKKKKTKKNPKPPPHLTTPALASLISLIASATALCRRFLSDHDLLLLPSQTLTLESLLSSPSLSPSHLLSLSPQILTLHIPPPPPATSSWFHRFLASLDDLRWRETFRMSRPSFYLLLQTLAPSLQSSPLHVPAEHKLAAALFRLAHAAPFRSVARRFDLPTASLACRAFYEALRAVIARLAHLFELPSDLPRVLQGFHWMSLPNCCGVVGFTGFSLAGTRMESLIAQGLVDSEGRFLDISVGWHGAMSPAKIITQTKLYQSHATVLANGTPVQLNGGSVNRYLLGGACCPLLPWLLTPFTGVEGSSDSSKAAIFNCIHKRGMELADQAFGRVRARWQLLQTRWTEECAEALPYVVTASCLLHNYLIKCSESMTDDVEVGERAAGFPDFAGKVDEDGVRVREILSSHLSTVSTK